MAEVIDIIELPRGVQLKVKLSNGEIHHVNFSKRHFAQLTNEELNRILAEMEEESQIDVQSKIMQMKQTITGGSSGG